MTPKTFHSWTKIAVVCALFALTVSPAQAQAGTFTRVSVDSNEVQANAISYRGDVSADGRFVAFDSEATNLTLNDVNNASDIFLRDLTQGTTTLVSVNAGGAQADAGSGVPSISADGHFVAFESSAANLAALLDANGFTDIYVKDMQTGSVTRASLSSTGAEPNNESASPSISGDGRFVVFDSDADNLVPNDLNSRGDIFLRDPQLGTTLGISTLGNAGGYDASIALDGRFVVFNSTSSNLVPNDTNAKADTQWRPGRLCGLRSVPAARRDCNRPSNRPFPGMGAMSLSHRHPAILPASTPTILPIYTSVICRWV